MPVNNHSVISSLLPTSPPPVAAVSTQLNTPEKDVSGRSLEIININGEREPTPENKKTAAYCCGLLVVYCPSLLTVADQQHTQFMILKTVVHHQPLT